MRQMLAQQQAFLDGVLSDSDGSDGGGETSGGTGSDCEAGGRTGGGGGAQRSGQRPPAAGGSQGRAVAVPPVGGAGATPGDDTGGARRGALQAADSACLRGSQYSQRTPGSAGELPG
eukprot:166785-Chlamydomonas_euryale.AAC.1